MVQCKVLAEQRRERSQEVSGQLAGNRGIKAVELSLSWCYRCDGSGSLPDLKAGAGIRAQSTDFEHGRQNRVVVKAQGFYLGTQRVLCY